MDKAAELRTQGEKMYAAGDLAGAAGAFRRLVGVQPDDAEAHNDLGAVFFQLGRHAESARHLARALQLDPDHEQAKVNFSAVGRALGVSTQSLLESVADAGGAASRALECDISVVIPVHDQFEPLVSCLEALQAQTLADERYEVLLVANGMETEADDELHRIARAWRGAFGERLRRLDVPEASIPLARNEGVRQARGRVILQMNSDTVLSNSALAEHLSEHERFGFDARRAVVGGRKFTDAYLKSLFNYLHEAVPLYTPLDKLRSRFLGDHTWFITCNLSAPRESYERFGMFDPSFAWGSDQELGRRWEHGHGVQVYVNTGIVSYHFHRLSFDQWRSKCIMAAPIWFRRNTGIHVCDLPEEGKRAVWDELANLTVDAAAVEQEMRRIEARFDGPDAFTSETVMGSPAFTLEEFVFRLRAVLKDYRKYLQYNEICGLLDQPEAGGPPSADLREPA